MAQPSLADAIHEHGTVAKIPEDQLKTLGFERYSKDGVIQLRRKDAPPPPVASEPPPRGNKRQRERQLAAREQRGGRVVSLDALRERGELDEPLPNGTPHVELGGADVFPMIGPEPDDLADDQDLAEPDDEQRPETDEFEGYETCLDFARGQFQYVVGPKELGKILHLKDWYETHRLKADGIPNQATIEDMVLELSVKLSKPQGRMPVILFPFSVGEEKAHSMGIPWLIERFQQKVVPGTPALYFQALTVMPLPKRRDQADLDLPTFTARAAAKLFAHALKHRQKEVVELVEDEATGKRIGLFFDGMTVHPRPVGEATHYVEA